MAVTKTDQTSSSTSFEFSPDHTWADWQTGLESLDEVRGSSRSRQAAVFLPSHKDKNAVDLSRAISLLGLALGIFPPAAFFSGLLSDLRGEDSVIIAALIGLVIFGSAATGFFTGKVVGNLLEGVGKAPTAIQALLTPLLGMLWGIVAGGAGGAFLFLIGSVFGAVIGGMVGLVSLPLFWGFARFTTVSEKIPSRALPLLLLAATLPPTIFLLLVNWS